MQPSPQNPLGAVRRQEAKGTELRLTDFTEESKAQAEDRAAGSWHLLILQPSASRQLKWHDREAQAERVIWTFKALLADERHSSFP